MKAFVLDNSVAMRWCFDFGEHAYADGILSLLRQREAVAWVPSLWRYEAASVLSKAEIGGRLEQGDIERFLRILDMLDIVTDAMSWANALHSVRKLAVQTRLTGYDAAYLELAHRRGIPLATLDLDLDLLKAAQAIGVPVIQHQPSQ